MNKQNKAERSNRRGLDQKKRLSKSVGGGDELIGVKMIKYIVYT